MTASVTSRLAVLVCLIGVLGMNANPAHAQQPPLGDEFFFFAEGSNVTIPDFGGQIVTDPTNSENTVAKFNYSTWAAPGWRWDGQDGVDMSANVGAAVGEGDTLYARIWASSDNIGKPNVGIVMYDAVDESSEVWAEKDVEFRLLWVYPPWLMDNEWHDLAIPFPPSTIAALDSAKIGKNADGTDLTTPLDTLAQYWSYVGGWVSSVSTYVNPNGQNCNPNDANDCMVFKDFTWEHVHGLAQSFDNADGGGTVFIDDLYIGGPNTDISVATSAPSAMGAVSVAADGAENVVSWTHNPEFGGYNVYVSDAPITSLGKAGEVVKLGTVPFSADAFEYRHRPEYPHPSLAGGALYYAVSSTSAFGVENPDVSASATEITNPDAEVAPYVGMLTSAEGDALFAAVSNGEVTPGALANFTPFGLNASHSRAGDSPLPTGGDVDNSANIWLGIYYDAANDINELYMYAEVTDDVVSLAPPTPDANDPASCGGNPCGGTDWNFDSIEINWGSYEVPWLLGSTHTSIEDATTSRGATPDHQLRFSLSSDGAGGILNDAVLLQPGPNGLTWEFPSHQPSGAPIVNGASVNGDFLTDGANVVGWKVLAVMPFESIIDPSPQPPLTPDAIFQPPAMDEIKIVPFNLMLNDQDEGGSRESQMQWSIKPNAGGGAWSNPLMWTVTAVAGRDLAVAIDEEGGEVPMEFALEQNYPNPFNPATTIRFALASTENVSLTVYDVLGREVMTLINNQQMSAGRYRASFDAEKLASGMYVYRLSAGTSFVETRTMILVK
jgi:hypothetical protein